MARIAEVITEFCSHTFPRQIGRWLPTFGDALVTHKASWWPVWFFGIGLGLGGFHFGYHNVLTESLILVSGVAAVASFRVQWGAYFFMGLIVGDLFFFRTTYIFQINRHYYYRSTFDWFVRVCGTGLATIIYYYLVSMICYRIPLFCRKIAAQTNYNPVAHSVLNVGMSGLLIYFWVLAYPVLIRPVWTWAHSIPPVSAIMPIQRRGGWVVLAAVVAAIVREWWLKRSGQVANDHGFEVTSSGTLILPKKVMLFVRPAVGTFLISGLLTTWWDTLLLFGILFLFTVVRSGNYIQFPKVWIRFMDSIPLWARFLIGLVLSWYLAAQIPEEMWTIGSTALFFPLIMSFGMSLLIIFLLFPPGTVPTKEKI